MPKDVANDPQNQSLVPHQFEITIFPDNFARRKTVIATTLAELEQLMRQTLAPAKDKLPLLKLARFGDTPTMKKCLRHDANMGDITGIEVEHDAGTIPYKRAVRILKEAKLVALVYTTPSHVPITKERWRALLPCQMPHDKRDREGLVAWVNGLFEGQLAPESFNLSQAFYFGSVGEAAARITVLDGDFVDQGTIKADPIGRPPPVGKGPTMGPRTSHSLADLDAMLEASRQEGHWHNNIRDVTASLARRGWKKSAIASKCGPYCRHGEDDPELEELIDSAIREFGPKPIPAGLVTTLKNLRQEKPEEAPDTEEAPPQPEHSATLQDKANWLLATRGQYEDEGRVIKLYEASSACRVKPADFRDAFTRWREVQIGPRGGQSFVHATDIWQASPQRIMVEGIRMAPDKSFPLFDDEGKLFKNTYRRPRHEAVASADVSPFLTFLERLIPDEVEREWLLDWMAHKLAHPEVPGVAVLFVADNDQDEDGAREGRFGTGRGLLFSIVRALYGKQYCAEQDFQILDGSSGQSAYTDWMHDRVLITCDESPSSPTYYRRGERVVAYEILKRIIDPAITDRTFTAKHRQAFQGRSHCSIWIATNHIDALAIPADDRRITVLRNGRVPDEAEISEIVAWREAKGSLATLVAFLQGRDISGFTAYRPLNTRTKQEMVSAGIGSVEETMIDIAKDENRGLVFLREDLFNAVRAQHNQNETVNGHFEDAWRRHVVKALGHRGHQGEQRQLRVNGIKKRLFCFRRNARTVQGLSEGAVQAEAMKWRPGLSVL